MSQYLMEHQHEIFSTPPTSPAPLMDGHRPSLSRKSSRPISLHLSKQQDEWAPDVELATSPIKTTIMSAVDPQPLHPPQPHKPVTSPCFVHSQLDSGMVSSEYFRSKPHDTSDVGLANSLQDLNRGIISTLDSQLDDEDDDELGNTLTKCLAETAVAVRDMSKQLGRARIQSNIQTILIVTKARDNRLIKLTRQLALYLMLKRRPGAARGLVVYVDSQLRHSRRFDAESIKRDHPELFTPFPRRASSTHSLSSLSSASTHAEFKDDGQLRYWTSSMCRNNPHRFDFVITLGGDGTVLFTSWLFQRIVPPVLPFALGSLGFLTNFDFARCNDVIDSVTDNGIRVNLRMRFTCTVYRAVANREGNQHKAVKRGDTGEILMKNLEQGGWEALEGGWSGGGTLGDGKAHGRDKQIMCFTTRPVETFEVLNDLVVDRGPSPYVSQLELFGDEHHMTTVQADGLTVATPTGSTAYSLSAGGSLVHPEIPAMLITPICPHTLSFRPMLLPDTMELRICVPYNSRSTAWASFDGRGRVELKQGDHIKVTASKYPFPTVCAEQQSTDWFLSISRTLKWNERERQKSFVVVEEDAPPRVRKNKRKSNDATPPVPATANSEEDEEDENSEDEEKFDIDDSAPEASSNSSGITNTDRIIGIEKTRKLALSNRKRSKSRTHSPAPTSGSASPLPSGVTSPSRYATRPPHPPFVTGRHVGFDVPSSPSSTSSDSLISDATHEGTRDDIRFPNHPGAKSRIPKDRDFDFDHIKTPTAGHHGHHRTRSAILFEPRVFAVRGQDESDSAASDADP